MQITQLRLFDLRPVRYDPIIANNSRSVIRKLQLVMNQATPFSVSRLLHRVGLALLCMAAILSAACVYHTPIQQGNLLDDKDIAQIAVGMTQSQVRYVLGTPMVTDPFSTSRWDYVYYLKVDTMPEAKKQQLIVYFENGNVSRLERTGPIFMKPDATKSDRPWYKRWLGWLV